MPGEEDYADPSSNQENGNVTPQGNSSSKSTSWSEDSTGSRRGRVMPDCVWEAFERDAKDCPPGFEKRVHSGDFEFEDEEDDAFDMGGPSDAGSSQKAGNGPNKVLNENIVSAEGSEHLWSVGSELHESNECKPCIWLRHPSGCNKGEGCNYCHLYHPKSRRTRPSKEFRAKCKDLVAQLDERFPDDPQPFVEAARTMGKYMENILKGRLTGQNDVDPGLRGRWESRKGGASQGHSSSSGLQGRHSAASTKASL
eukprot:gnl/TRDRNA2_/TRDRNA2_169632_c1_seq4.p1 gnl/TRDRNA2_/TRDRNA2_169632_c1~~gnl/TRDRNA2_/TRDRNA2_169632_c1_seq4.p1  ORF type:complete len:254 (+),score=21.34 gnl/TRDRNA2_/TRDRNA2_169632_c1_seq4:101-862(+)